MKNAKLRSICKNIITVIVGIAFIFAILFIGFIISQFLRSNEFSFQSCLILILFIGGSVLIAKQTHQLGHFLAGTILRFQLVSYNFQEIIMIPKKKDCKPTHFLWYYASGILCNLLLGIIALLLLAFFSSQKLSLLELFLFTLGITWLCSGALQSVSYFSEGVPTDGKIIWGLLFHSDFSNYYIATTNLFHALKQGVRPANLLLNAYEDDNQELQSSDIVFLLYLYYQALDLQNASALLKYSQLLEDNFALIPQHLQAAVICELCYTSTLKGEADVAKSYFSFMREFPAEDRTLSFYRACAYYYFYNKGNTKQALSAISYSLDTISSCPFSGMVEMEQSLLQTLLQEIREIL